MSKVVLSNGYEFELANNTYSAESSTLSFTFISDGYTLEEIENIFTGVNSFKVVDGEDSIANYYGYPRVDVLSRYPEFYLGVNPETGDAIYKAVTTITLSKPDIDARVSDIEDSIYDIIDTILGGGDELAGLEETPADGE